MDTSMMIELFGYLGSLLVVVSMLMTSVMKLRVINTIGAGIFSVYALIIHSYPTALMNICLVIINVYNLMRLLRKDRHYDLVEGNEDEAFLRYFLRYYHADIVKYFPEFCMEATNADVAYVVCTDAVPAGIFLGKKRNENTIEVILDYSTPAYRDYSIGTFLYSEFSKREIRKLVYTGTEEKHISYLKKMGFVLDNKEFVKFL